MRILYFTKYTRKGASSRMRSYQYFPFLESEGLIVEVSPLFSDSYLEALYTGTGISKGLILSAYFSRFLKLFSLAKYQRIVIEKELFPYLPSWAEWILKVCGVKYIVDYDDAIFHNYDQHKNNVVRWILGNKIDQVMKYSQAVVAGNNYLKERAVKAGAKNVVVIPTVIDLERYKKKEHTTHHPVVIGWIGTKSTFIKHFEPIKEVIQTMLSRYPVEFHVVGVTEDLGLGNRVKYFSWSEEQEVSLILNFDIGIMPLENSLWEQGKCAYKLIQYMACGLPVVASPVGMNTEVIVENTNGLLARTENEWIASLSRYIEDRLMRTEHGSLGYKLVKENFCIQVTGQRLIKIIKEWS